MIDDTTTARRALLELIVRTVEDDDLTLIERGLLRPLVEAEMAHGQAMIDQFTAAAPWLKAAAEDHAALQQRHQDLIAETRRQGDVHERTAKRAKQAEATVNHVRSIVVEVANADPADTDADAAVRSWAHMLLGALDRPAAAGAIRCAAQYAGEPGETWHCTLDTGHPGDHVTAADGNRYWNDHMATYPAAAPVEEPTP